MSRDAGSEALRLPAAPSSAERPSFLESGCTTGHRHDDAFLEQFAKATAPHRERQARKHDERARSARKAALEVAMEHLIEGRQWPEERRMAAFVKTGKLRDKGTWHKRRAAGQRNRIEKVAGCRTAKLEVTCCECGVVRETGERCDVVRVCLSCRGRRAQQGKRRFGAARHEALRAARHLLSRRMRGRWSEKLLTLTVPHVGSTERRIELLFAAWRRFSRWLQGGWRALRARLGVSPAYFRAFEWTPGHDLLGHPHFHLWLLCPFLDFDEARQAWRAALVAEGLDDTATSVVVIDIREVRVRPAEIRHEVLKGEDALRFSIFEGVGGEDAVQYMSGWCIVDEVNRQRVPVEVLADVYAALEGKRLTQPSSGFMRRLESACGDCGAVAPRVRVSRVPLSPTVQGHGHGGGTGPQELPINSVATGYGAAEIT